MLKPGNSPKRLAREKLTAFGDPLRIALVSVLCRAPASAKQIAEALEEDPARVRYQIRRMREVGLVELVGETRRRGVRENLYSVDPVKHVLEAPELVYFSPEEIDRAIAAFARLLFREARGSIGNPMKEERENPLVRVPLPLDEEGWSRAMGLYRQTLADVLKVRERSLERLADSGGEAISALAMIFFFALAPDPEERPEGPEGEG